MMSVKPTVMPISPNDARSAIRVQKQLEADILRLREDIKRRSCNIPAARQAIAFLECNRLASSRDIARASLDVLAKPQNICLQLLLHSNC